MRDISATHRCGNLRLWHFGINFSLAAKIKPSVRRRRRPGFFKKDSILDSERSSTARISIPTQIRLSRAKSAWMWSQPSWMCSQWLNGHRPLQAGGTHAHVCVCVCVCVCVRSGATPPSDVIARWQGSSSGLGCVGLLPPDWVNRAGRWGRGRLLPVCTGNYKCWRTLLMAGNFYRPNSTVLWSLGWFSKPPPAVCELFMASCN